MASNTVLWLFVQLFFIQSFTLIDSLLLFVWCTTDFVLISLFFLRYVYFVCFGVYFLFYFSIFILFLFIWLCLLFSFPEEESLSMMTRLTKTTIRFFLHVLEQFFASLNARLPSWIERSLNGFNLLINQWPIHLLMHLLLKIL